MKVLVPLILAVIPHVAPAEKLAVSAWVHCDPSGRVRDFEITRFGLSVYVDGNPDDIAKKVSIQKLNNGLSDSAQIDTRTLELEIQGTSIGKLDEREIHCSRPPAYPHPIAIIVPADRKITATYAGTSCSWDGGFFLLHKVNFIFTDENKNSARLTGYSHAGWNNIYPCWGAEPTVPPPYN